MSNPIKKVLIANRGEIALRIIRACKELEIKSVAIFSTADIDGMWVRKADECYPIVDDDQIKVYLDYERIITIAKRAECDAIHPGYGFLSESSEFAQAVIDAGLIFIGPKPEHVKLFGDKITSKKAMREVGVPVLPGNDDAIEDVAEGIKFAKEIGFPVIIKAAFGGGGRGMRIVHDEGSFEKEFDAAYKEALRFFGNGKMFIEKYMINTRHIEVQVIADKYGNVLHLGERDCSIQRRHQKVIEIAPSPLLSNEVRKDLYRVSTKAMFRLGYESVGTVEFLVDDDDNFYFMEMNTRIQVEHPITEIISGVDLVQRMIEIAGGDKMIYLQEEIEFRGYAIEFRINAEDASWNFAPRPGKLEKFIFPGGPGVRMDTAAFTDYEIPPYYDSMIGKLIVWALDWEGAVKKAKRALDEFCITGVPTNIALHKQIVQDIDFKRGSLKTDFLDQKLDTFNLEAIDTSVEENARMEEINLLMETIAKNNITTR